MIPVVTFQLAFNKSLPAAFCINIMPKFRGYNSNSVSTQFRVCITFTIK